MTQHTNISQQLSEFLFKTRYEDLPPHVIHEAKRSLVNYFAVCFAAGKDETIAKAIDTYKAFSGGGRAKLVGRNIETDILSAAALNAMAANVFDFDDTHIPTIIHPSAPVAAALFALSADQQMSGQDFLLSFILGVDLECRIGNAVSPMHYSKGWHITSTCGVFGAGAACAKAIGLSVQQFLWMLGNASAQASGLVETLGTMSKSLSVGNAARNGLLSALLAKGDFSGPQFPLEGERGFFKVYGESADFEVLLSHIGVEWEILKNTYKPYPCGVVLNPVIEGCITLFKEIKEGRLDLREIDYIELKGHPLLRQRTDRGDIKTGRQSQVSAQHAVGIVLTKGCAGLAEFSDEAVGDQFAKWVGSKTRFVDDVSMQVESACVGLYFKDKRELQVRVDHAKGSLQVPLTDKELEGKLLTLSKQTHLTPSRAGVGSELECKNLLEKIWAIETMDDVSTLLT